MSNKKEEVKEEVIVSVGNETANAVNNAVLSGSVGDLLSKAKPRGFSLTSDFLTMEEGEVSRFAAMEFGTVTVKDQDSDVKDATKEVDCIYMVNEEGKTVCAAQTIIVNTLKSQIPCAVEISEKGTGGTGNRKYQNFDISLLQLDDLEA